MNMFDIPEHDRSVVLVAAIIAALILSITAIIVIGLHKTRAEAFKNGYEQIVENSQVLWKKHGNQTEK